MSAKPILMNTEKDLMQEPGAFYNGIIANITDEAIEFENRCMGEALRRWQISKEDVLARIREADKLRAETEKLRAELEQIPSCIYYKQGGLCRYGGDDPANVCVLGPCDHDVSVQDVLTEECFRMEHEVPGWSSDTKWPQSALDILSAEEMEMLDGME